MVERLASPAAHELDALTDLWERSVRATHDFLAPEDIPFFRRMVRQEALPAAEIYVIRVPETDSQPLRASEPTGSKCCSSRPPRAEKVWGANSWSTSRSIAECDAWM